MSKGEETRQEIIRKSAALFNQRGFAGTSMNDIMEATGLEKGGLYRHFTAKQELAVEAFDYALALVFTSRLQYAEGEDDSIARLHAMIDHFVKRPSPLAGGCPLMNTGIDADDTNPELRALALRGLQTWKKWIVRTMEEGKKQGRIRKGADCEKFANQVIAGLEGALLLARMERNRNALADAAEGLKAGLAALTTGDLLQVQESA